ncbi:MAG: 16S rRNA (uracil(1498)-N(3))-methyltransferase [Bacteroidia bacterium]|nr:16S rRNA (uracil(1498)-N(3))-methyltransferase [Bacteroidia bacterium]
MDLFYDADFSESNPILNETESHHLVKVLRARVGDPVRITNGKGDFFNARIAEINTGTCLLKVERKYPEMHKKYRLHIAVAPTKSQDRMEWLLEKATEIGIDEITPVVCMHSERRTLQMQRLNKIMVAALKQSMKATLPVLHPISSFDEIIRTKGWEQKFICTEGAGKHLKVVSSPSLKYLVLIGPEGDFHPDEVARAKDSGFLDANLGGNRLRTETAALQVVSYFSILNA